MFPGFLLPGSQFILALTNKSYTGRLISLDKVLLTIKILQNMEEKIRVAIGGFPNETAIAIAEAICHSTDMQLFNHALSEPDFANRHLKIACVYTEMYNMERTPLFFEQEFDVLVDCFMSDDPERTKFYTESKIPLVVIALGFSKDDKIDTKEILDNIRLNHQMVASKA